MKSAIHPFSHLVTFICHCGQHYQTQSTIISATVKLDVCARCHPLYSGKQVTAAVGSRVKKFTQRFEKGRSAT